MILASDLYEIKFTPSETLLRINRSISINIKLIDFNGNNVSGKNITVKCDKGVFTNNNSNTYTNTTGNNGLNVNFKTDSNGIITITVIVEGVVRKENLQLYADTFKRMILNGNNNDGDVYLYINDRIKQCFLYYPCKLTKYYKKKSSDTSYFKILENNGFIPELYRPKFSNVCGVAYRPDIVFYVTMDGGVNYRVEEDKKLDGSAVIRLSWTY